MCQKSQLLGKLSSPKCPCGFPKSQTRTEFLGNFRQVPHLSTLILLIASASNSDCTAVKCSIIFIIVNYVK